MLTEKYLRLRFETSLGEFAHLKYHKYPKYWILKFRVHTKFLAEEVYTLLQFLQFGFIYTIIQLFT